MLRGELGENCSQMYRDGKISLVMVGNRPIFTTMSLFSVIPIRQLDVAT